MLNKIYLSRKNDFIKLSVKFLFLGKDPIIEAKVLNTLLKEDEEHTKNLKIIDCTFYENQNFPVSKEIPNFFEERIPNSIKIDLDKISDSKKSEYNLYMFPSEENFTHTMNLLNIKKSDHIVCYDRHGIYSSARLWYVLKLFGMKNVYVLNGGYPSWVREKFPIDRQKLDSTLVNPGDRNDTNKILFKKDASKLIQTEEMLYKSYNFLKNKSDDIIIDVRTPTRTLGEHEEPYPVRRKGSIRYSANIYYRSILDKNFCLLNKPLIKKYLESELIELDKELVIYSGVGISACVFMLALDFIGKDKKVKLYEGGWAEMGNVEVTGNPIIQKFVKYEERSPKEQTEEILSKMDKKAIERTERANKHEYKLIDIKEKNKEYLKKKMKEKENDYESPDEKF